MNDPNVSLIIPLYYHNDTTSIFCSQEITMFDGQTVFLEVKSTCLMVKAYFHWGSLVTDHEFPNI